MSLKWFFAVSATLATVSGAAGQELVAPFAPPAGSEAAKFYEDNAAAIEALIERVRSGSGEAGLQAFDTLATSYPDAALGLATKLVSGDDAQLALAAARLLADSIVMTNHPGMEHMHDASPEVADLMRRIEASKTALRTLLNKPDSALRQTAAGILASLGDVPALDLIKEGAQSGEIPEVEAINYFALARPDVGSPYIEPYLADGAGPAKQSAVSYLGALPQYQAQIRTDVLLNETVGEDVRIAAADVLSKYDASFGTYALAVAANPGVPPGVYLAVVGAYADAGLRDRSLSSETAQALSAAIAAYSKQNLNPLEQKQAEELLQRIRPLQ